MLWARALASAACALLAGCSLPALLTSEKPAAEPPQTPVIGSDESFSPDKQCGGKFSQQQRMYLELIHKMVGQGQNYAAIAHLDQLEKTAEPAPQTVYLRAEALRGTGARIEAEKRYRSLLGGCMAGYGMHGLGLLAVEAGRLDQAEDFLKQASRERPVDAEIHNDLGMVLMLRGQFKPARQEFLTARELDEKNRLPAENLIVLALAEKHRPEAQRLAVQWGFTARDMERMSERAQRLPAPSVAGNDTRSP